MSALRWSTLGIIAVLTACFDPTETEIGTDGGTDPSAGTESTTTNLTTSTSAGTTMTTDPTETSTSTTDPTATSTTDTTEGSTGVESFCGDGVMDDGEECDDGDQEAGDGCSAACLDESDRCEPGLVGALNLQNPGRMVANGGYLYYFQNSIPSGFRVVDVSNPATPMQVGVYDIDTDNYPNWRALGVVYHPDGYVLTAGSGPELVVMDVNTPTAPTDAHFGGPNDADGHIHIEGNLLYQAYSVGEQVRILNATDITSPSFSQVIGNPNRVFTNVGAFGDLAAITGNGGHLEIWDQTVLGMPAFTGEMDLNPATTGIGKVLMDDDTIFLATNNRGVVLVDYNLPSVPTEASTIGSGYMYDIALRGDFLYVPVTNGLQVWDVSDHDDPQLAGNYLEVDAFSDAVTTDDNYVYFTNDGSGMRILGEMPGFCDARCGNNHVEYPEDCDDGNLDDGDGCPADCGVGR